MKYYLITDLMTGAATWTPGETLAEALVAHENARRAGGADPMGRELPPLAPGVQCWHDHDGPVLRAGIGESAIRGLNSRVVREA